MAKVNTRAAKSTKALRMFEIEEDIFEELFKFMLKFSSLAIYV